MPLILHLDLRAHGAEIITQVKFSRRLDSRQQSHGYRPVGYSCNSLPAGDVLEHEHRRRVYQGRQYIRFAKSSQQHNAHDHKRTVHGAVSD